MIQLVFFHTSLLIDAGILSLLTNADNPFPFVIAIYSTKFEMLHGALSPRPLTSLPTHIGSSVSHDTF